MRVKDAVWQGCFGDWQPLFIREYWLPLGYVAWQGFLRQGRGLVQCEVRGVSAAIDWGIDPVAYTAEFVAQAALPNRWQGLGLAAEHWPALDTVVAGYEPAQDIILLLLGDAQPYITHLQGWAVPPPECSRQMGASRRDPSQTRQAEFNLSPAP
ncbi:MAG: hypothetical protein WBA99_01275 [Nodosilinea sp.]